MFFVGDPGMPDAFSFNKVADFAPRAGIAWNPDGAAHQVLRAGFGLFYDSPMLFYYNDAGVDPPWASAITITSHPGGLTNPYQGYPGGNPFPQPSPPSPNQPFLSESAYYNYPLRPQPTYMLQWNLSYERQLPANWLVSATYLGNKTTHIWTGEEADPAVYIPGTCNGSPWSSTKNTNQRRVLYLLNPVTGSLISNIYQADMGGNAEYHGLLLKAQHRFNSRYSVVANYTYSHCISEGDFQGDLGGELTQNPYNRNGERGNCGFDLRHIFNASIVAVTRRSSNRWMDKLVGNWQLAPIISIHSGTWFSPFTGVDNSLTGIGLDRPNVLGNPYASGAGTRQWLNAAAFHSERLGRVWQCGIRFAARARLFRH
jgi:hypothetical protein